MQRASTKGDTCCSNNNKKLLKYICSWFNFYYSIINYYKYTYYINI